VEGVEEGEGEGAEEEEDRKEMMGGMAGMVEEEGGEPAVGLHRTMPNRANKSNNTTEKTER
jgi:hypothetical protein